MREPTAERHEPEAERPRGEVDGGEAIEIEGIIAEYLARLDSGEVLDPEKILAEHPGVGRVVLEALRRFVDLGETVASGAGQAADSSGGDAAPPEARKIGDYTLRGRLGQGGMGVVYDAWQHSLDRRVALKVLPAGIASDTKACSRFLREAQIVAKLSHPNVVSVYGFGVEAETLYFSMELVEGETLAAALARLRTAKKKTLFGNDTDTTAYYSRLAEAFAGAAEGLQHAHSKRIVHRDIKPSNLILDPDGKLRILDFGLAHLEGQESLTISGDLVGTPRYMSPEQARRRKVEVDHRTDVYSLGATLYEMVAWRPPFEGRDYHDTLSRIIEDDPAPPRELNSRVPLDLETIVLKCLRKDPRDRYGTAEALAQDLRRFSRGDPIEARPQSTVEKLVRRASRHRWKLAAAALVIALLGGVLWLLWANLHQARREAAALHRQKLQHLVVNLYRGQLSSEAGGPPGSRAHASLVPAFQPEDLPRLLGLAGPSHLREILKELELVRRALPGEAAVPYYRARTFLLLRQEAEALAELEQALRSDPRFVPAEALKEELLRGREREEPAGGNLAPSGTAGPPWTAWWLEAYRAARERRWGEAIPAYDLLLGLLEEEREPYPGAALDLHLGRGLAHLETGEFDAAIRDFERVDALAPPKAGFLEPDLLQGKAYYLRGAKEEAKKIFEEVYRRASSRGEAALLIASVYGSVRDHDEALRWGGRLVNPALQERFKATILYGAYRWQEAIAAGKRAAELAPEDPLARVVLGHAMLAQYLWGPLNAERDLDRELRELAAVVEEAERLGPRSPEVKVLQAQVLEAGGRFAEAVTVAARAVELGLDPAVGHYLLGMLHVHQRNLREALPHFEAASRLDPGNAVYHFVAGFCASSPLRSPQPRAAAAFQEAARLDPGWSWPEYSLGEARYVEGNYEEAIEHLQRSLTLLPPVQAGGVLATALFNAGRVDEAVAVMEQLKSVSRNDPPLRFYALLALRGRLEGSPELRQGLLDKALRFARLVVEKSEGFDPEVYIFLAGVHFLRGELQGAIRTLETASADQPTQRVYLQSSIEELRRRALPDLLTFASIDWAFAERDREDLIADGASWRYAPGHKKHPPGGEWVEAAFDDSSWEEGPGGFGFGVNETAVRTRVDAMKGASASLHARKLFEVRDRLRFRRLLLTVTADDGFIAYLNGQEVGRARAGKPSSPPPATATWASAGQHRWW